MRASRERCAPSARSRPGSVRVPPLSFLTTSVVCSTWRPAGLLHPAAGHGVRRVSGDEARPVSRSSSPLSPRRHALRSVPLVRSRTASPRCTSRPHIATLPPRARLRCRHVHRRSLPSRRSCRFPLLRCACRHALRLASGVSSTSTLCSANRVRCPPPPLPVARGPMLPWACCSPPRGNRGVGTVAGLQAAWRQRSDPEGPGLQRAHRLPKVAGAAGTAVADAGAQVLQIRPSANPSGAEAPSAAKHVGAEAPGGSGNSTAEAAERGRAAGRCAEAQDPAVEASRSARQARVAADESSSGEPPGRPHAGVGSCPCPGRSRGAGWGVRSDRLSQSPGDGR